MAEHPLTGRSALDATTPRNLVLGGARLEECPIFSLACVAARRGQERSVETALAARIGAPCPVSAYVAREGCGIFWTAPGQWFVMDQRDRGSELATDLMSELAGSASITDQTDGWFWCDVSGPGTGQILERLCPIDPAELGPGQVRRTVIEHIGVIVLNPSPGVPLRFGCGRSYAHCLWDALAAALHTAAALSGRPTADPG